jgi:hypothetical protein
VTPSPYFHKTLDLNLLTNQIKIKMSHKKSIFISLKNLKIEDLKQGENKTEFGSLWIGPNNTIMGVQINTKSLVIYFF